MLIQSLAVEGIGRFGTPAYVEGFGEGVNVLAAPNEVGKSTLFRAIRQCLFARHDSKSQDIRDMATEGSQLPATVQLKFSRAGHNYVLRKSFLRSPMASLVEGGQEIARGKQADEAVWEILGLRPGSGRTLDDGAFGLLWVGQGRSFGSPEFGTGASSLLNAAIESEVGTLLGGERARSVLDGISGDLGKYLTPSGQKPLTDGPLHRALEGAEHWRKAAAESATKIAALDTQFQELAMKRRRHAELTDPVAADQVQKNLLQAKNEVSAARSAALELRRYEAEESSAQRALETAAQRLGQHRELASRIATSRLAAETLAQSLPDLAAREQEARTALRRAADQIGEIEEQLLMLSEKQQRLDRLAAARLHAQRKGELAARLKAIEELAQQSRETEAALTQISVKQKTVEDLDALELKIGACDVQVSAAAAQLTVQIKPAGAGKVSIAGAQAAQDFRASVLAPITIDVGDLALLTVTPAVHPTLSDRNKLADQRAALLKAAGITSGEEAHAALAKRRELEATRKAIASQMKAFKVEDDVQSLIGELKAGLAQADAFIAAALEFAERPGLPEGPEIEEQKLVLAQEREAVDGRRISLEQARKPLGDALESALGAYSAARSKLELMNNQIVESLALSPDADREAREAALLAAFSAAEGSHNTAALTLQTMRQAAPDSAEIERRESRCQRLEQALANQNEEARRLESDMGRLSGQIQAAGGDGVGEMLAAAQEQLTLAERESARLKERVAALQLLRATVASSLAEGRERYYEPVRRNLRPFLNDLFPGAELEMGDGFAITGFKRQRSESFDRLSDGTQEQIAVLVRLAMGAMLAEQNHKVPVILDDALVYCDDERIERMFDALSRAGKNQQLIVLTCRLRAFGSLGGHALRVQTGSVAVPTP